MFDEFFSIKNKSILFIIAILIIGSSIFFIYSKPTSSKNTEALTPTLFVHGYKGGPASFDTMLNRFEGNNWGSKRMTFHVSANGELFVYGRFLNRPNPYIQILFENDRASIKNQTIWLQKIMRTLYETYNIKQVNLVGHSMGGLASTNFLLHNQENVYPSVEKLIVMGSPFKGIDNEHYFSVNTGAATTDLQTQAEALQSMVENKANFDEHTEILAIAGVINKNTITKHASSASQTNSQSHTPDTAQPQTASNYGKTNTGEKQFTKNVPGSDGLVSLPSALGIREIVSLEKFNKKVFYDDKATHSGLHEHLGVDKKIASFLWGIQSQ